MRKTKLSPKNDFVIINAEGRNEPKSVIKLAYNMLLNHDLLGVVESAGDMADCVKPGDVVVFNSLMASKIKIDNKDFLWVAKEEHIKAIAND